MTANAEKLRDQLAKGELLMAVYWDTGGGDIYAGTTKEQCVAEMLRDCPELPINGIFEVGGDMEIRVEEIDGSVHTRTLDEEYIDLGRGYCISSENC